MTSVLIPLHNSAIEHSSIPQLLSFATTHVNVESDDGTDATIKKYLSMNLQCHSEGMLWRGLVPLLTQPSKTSGRSEPDNWKQTILALAILVGRYESYINPFHQNTLEERCSGGVRTTSLNDHAQTLEIHHTISDWLIITTPHKFHLNNRNHHLTIIIFPPNPDYNINNRSLYYSRTPTTSPTNSFTLRLIRHENTQIKLQSVTALLSTLGGGYFLCHHLSTALILAQNQWKVASMKGDEDMGWRCRINMGYCYFYAGKIKRGKKVVKLVLREVQNRLVQNNGENTTIQGIQEEATEKKKVMCNLTVIKNMCLSALWFADKLLEGDGNGSCPSVTHDDFKRVRVVKDRSSRVVLA